jgi:hypothetical protein
MSNVRLATREDETEIMGMCYELHAENGLATIDERLVRAMLARAFNRQGGIIGVIGEPKRTLEAFTYILISNLWYTSDHHLEELATYVRPKFRSLRHANLLINFAKRCSDDMSANMGKPIPLIIGVFTNTRPGSKAKLYKRQLGFPSGVVFVHNSPWKQAVDYSEREFWNRSFDRRGGRKVSKHNGVRTT